MHQVGPPEGPPLTIPGQQHWDEASAHAAVCILVALQNRASVGGQTIDISAHEVAATRDFAFDRYDVMGMAQDRTASIGYPPTGTWQCKDGPFDVAAHQTRHWTAFLRMLDDPPELSDPSLEDVLVRREIFDGLAETISKLLAGRSRNELVERGQAVGLPCSILNTPAEFVDDEQLVARDYFVTLRGSDGGDVRMPGAPFRSAPTLFSVARRAPCLGEHNADTATFSERGDARTSEAKANRANVRSIDQLRVLTFGAFIAGNTTGLILAELGADVVKIEAFARPEVLRSPCVRFQRDVCVRTVRYPQHGHVRRVVAQHAERLARDEHGGGPRALPASRRRRRRRDRELRRGDDAPLGLLVRRTVRASTRAS